MKIGIIIPLKSKKVATNWSVTCNNLEATVNRVLSQRKTTYEAAVVGHEQPNFMKRLRSTEPCKFIEFNEFAPPRRGKNIMKNQLKYEFDRCAKILKGIMILSKNYLDITHWFALDADDLISCDFVDVLSKYHDRDAIVLDKGYIYYKNKGVINIENEFSAYCGSSTVLSHRLVKSIPRSIDENNIKATPFGEISHVHMRKKLIEKGYSVAVPDERIVMYVLDNGENISNEAYCSTWFKKSKKLIKMFLKAKKIDKKVKKSFGI